MNLRYFFRLPLNSLKKSETEGLNFSVHLDELLDFIN